MRLITSFYIDQSSERQKELEVCLLKNISNTAIDEIILLTDCYSLLNVPDKVKVVFIHERPTFDVFFNYSGTGWNVVSNTDIYFDEGILEVEKRNKNEFLALCRYDVLKDDRVKFLNRRDAQDAWVFHGPCRIKGANFYQGIPGCDNSLAFKAEAAGYKVTNPSLTIRCYHLHNSGVRHYNTSVKVPQPYKLITPHK